MSKVRCAEGDWHGPVVARRLSMGSGGAATIAVLPGLADSGREGMRWRGRWGWPAREVDGRYLRGTPQVDRGH